jgi:C4-dicarboxylate transporter DctM subunit
MTEGKTEGSTQRHPLRQVDDTLFRVEDVAIAVFMIAVTVLIFFDVLARRLMAPDSRVGALIAERLLSIEDAGTRATIDHWVAPILTIAVLVGLTYFGFRTSERARGKTLLPFKASALVLTVAAAAGVALLCVLILTLQSRDVFLVVYAAAAIGLGIYLVRKKPEGWRGVLIGIVVFTPVFVWVAFHYFPVGYTWSQEFSMMLVLWVGFLGASTCVHAGKHLRLEALEKAAPEKARRWVRALSQLVAAVFCGLMAYLGWQYVFGAGGPWEGEAILNETGLPDWVMTVAIPIAFAFACVRLFASTISAALGGDYGAPAKAEGMEEAEKAADISGEAGSATQEVTQQQAAVKKRPPIAFIIVAALIVLAPLLGKGGILVSVILFGMLLAEPLFVVLGLVTITCFLLWGDIAALDDFKTIFVERMRGTADNKALLAIPLFIMSGAVMSHGQISLRLIDFAKALVGWMPGGLGIAAVVACMIFAAISGSSPATVVAIGGIMGPALIAAGYRPNFSLGLVTASGSLGILIPPSIPMIVYAIVNQSGIEVKRLFAAGFGPGLVIGGLLASYAVFRGIRDKAPRAAFSLKTLGAATRDGIWALMFPGLILGGIYGGLFGEVESAAISVVYAVIIEVFVYRSIRLAQIPKILGETGILLGSFLVILVIAMSFGDFLVLQGIPNLATEWLESMQLEPWQFLLLLNLLLLIVGCLMDIMSAIFIFVPLLAPMAAAMGLDPIHFGIIFIVNLEIGYLTPPVGLNLFVSSTLFKRPLTFIIKSVVPFILMMVIGLAVISYVPAISIGFANVLMGGGDAAPMPAPMPESPIDDEEPETETPTSPPGGTKVQTMEEMMREMEGGLEDDTEAEPTPPEGATKTKKVQTMEEMMREAGLE